MKKSDFIAKKSAKRAFTIVEVVITLVIIWILASIAFLGYGQYRNEANDATRHQDLKTISNLLEYEISMWKDLPQPDWFITTETYAIWWKEYTFSTGTFGSTKNDTFRWVLSSLPQDPNGWYYSYSVSEDGKHYILAATMNDGSTFKFSNFNDGWTGLIATNTKPKTPTSGETSGTDNGIDSTPPSFLVQNGMVFNVCYGCYANLTQVRAVDDKWGNVNYTYEPATVDTKWNMAWYDVPVTVKAVDSAWNQSTVNVVFKVWRKSTRPVFNKTNFSTERINKWQAVNYDEITATDEVDGNLTVTRLWQVNVNQVWEQIVKYQAKNSLNVITELVIKYNVVDPNAQGSNLADNFSSENCLNYATLASKKVVITGMKTECNWKIKDLVIPTTINWNPVTDINWNAFKSKWLATLSAPSAENIWAGAFESNQLTSIDIPSVKSIWANSFRKNKLTSIELPNVIYIWDSAFNDNWLTSVDIPNVTTIWAFAFQSNKLTSIDLPNATTILDYAFQNNRLTSLDLPNVTSIWTWAFQGNKLKSIDLPNVTTIWTRTFSNNWLTSINLPRATDIKYSAFEQNQLTSINLPNVTTIDAQAFRYNQLTSINLPKVTTINSSAFQNNMLIEVNLPASLTRIRDNVFKNNWVLIIRNESSLTEDQIKPAFDYAWVREYNWQER